MRLNGVAAFLGSAALVAGAAATQVHNTGAPGGDRPAATRPVTGPNRPALNLPADMPRAVAAARTARAAYGPPVSVILGQMILESGNGRSGLARRYNNYFGIKCGSGGPGPLASGCTPGLGTTEYYGNGPVRISDRFRAYRSPEASFLDYGRLLAGDRYRATRAHRSDPRAFLAALARAGYATTPGYDRRVMAIIDQQGLRRYDR